jgi:hypothetical protein
MIIDDLNPLLNTLEDIIKAEQKREIPNSTILNLGGLCLQARKDLKKHQEYLNENKSATIKLFELLATIESTSDISLSLKRHEYLEKKSDYEYFLPD